MLNAVLEAPLRPHNPGGEPAEVALVLRWTAAGHAQLFAEAVIALFSACVEEIFVTTDHSTRAARSAVEAARALGRASCVQLVTKAATLDLDWSAEATRIRIRGVDRRPFLEPLWLQADLELRSPITVLRWHPPAPEVSEGTLHPLIGLAHRCGGLERATAELPGGATMEWAPGTVGEALADDLDGAVWQPGPVEGACLRVLTSAPARTKPDHVAAVRSLLDSSEEPLAALQAWLSEHVRVRMVVRPFGTSREPFHVPPPAGALLLLVPEAEMVAFEVDLDVGPEVAAQLVAHAVAHVELGHVRPGDVAGHWDTLDTVLQPMPSRRWDREVQAAYPTLAAPQAPKRSSLAECTALEKGWLLVHQHIRQMLGGARSLHSAAERYQPAIYQRQAAQRLVAQLDEFGGAMLCDGVGLGKTYVATTVMVHFVNEWRDRLAQEGRSLSTDPFRITVLTPGSVVSTWQREAIPPLVGHGVPAASVRVVSHTRLSRILPSSEVLQRSAHEPSDLEHLLLSDLVVVDEAHNFRSIGARRTVVLRDLLRLQPRRDRRRAVLLLTATPVNNSLEDLRQQAALLFSRPLWFNDNTSPAAYRARVAKDIEERFVKAAKAKVADVAPIFVHGSADARFSYALEFRDDLQFGVQVPRVGDYLKEQEKRLQAQQQATRLSMMAGPSPGAEPVRIAAELLDRIVVQRSRELCKRIEREQGSDVKLLFRPDAPPPEKLVYEDVYDDTHDVLARFLPLFDAGAESETGAPPLSLKVYMWTDVRDGERNASETSSVVGLQRVLVLKRLESSPVAFLITVLRLLALHAFRLQQLVDLCRSTAPKQVDALEAQVLAPLSALDAVARDRMDLLLTGTVSAAKVGDLLGRWARAHLTARPAAGSDDPPPPQLDLFSLDDEESRAQREQLERLWALKDDLVRDFGTLLATAPDLAEIVFGRFDQDDWPRRFIAGGESVDWPTSAGWGIRVVTDAKLLRLVTRVLQARASRQKVIVFSQFSDTLAYIGSVLRATRSFDGRDWAKVLRSLSGSVGHAVGEDQVRDLIDRTAIVTGDTEDRDLAINVFAPFYRLGPWRPRGDGLTSDAQAELLDGWRQGWSQALTHPVDILLASDVLAEGVNLQDASLLVNYDVHWNPVRMIQRAGRIDRRLRPTIEEATDFPDLEALAAELGVPAPRYWWHENAGAAPVVVNLLLPDELEGELQLRERIANKTLAIDFTLGLDQGTGAEAEWMADYRYQGISALNAWQRDRAIEQVASYQERLSRVLTERGIQAEWLDAWSGWLRESGASDDAPILGWARAGRKGGEVADYTRLLTPCVADGAPHWLWSPAKPGESLLNFWLRIDGTTWPPRTRTDLPWSPDASRPVSAEDLLRASVQLLGDDAQLVELGREVGKPLMQGVSALSAGFLGTDADRRAVQIAGFRVLQLRPRPSAGHAVAPLVPRRGISRPCPTCDHAAGMHKCCPSCGASANGEAELEQVFGFRLLRAVDGAPYDIPQTWCRSCRVRSADAPASDPNEAS